MRTIAVFFVLVLSIAVGGCSRAGPTSGGNQQTAGGNQPGFKPGLNLKWPGTPTVLAGDQEHYAATLTQKEPEGLIVFSAFVMQYPELQGADPNELLGAYVFGSQKSEISRKKIEFGRDKHPGFDIATRSGSRFGRKIVVMAGPRLYEISVLSTNEKLLGGPEVRAFIDSFKPDE
jgi:hypothetical protein